MTIPNPWLLRAFGQKMQEAKQKGYVPDEEKPIGDWLKPNKVWTCKCMPNLAPMRHDHAECICPHCHFQRPADVDFLKELTED